MKEEELLELFKEHLYIDEEEFFNSGKREGVDARTLFTTFFLKNHKGSNYGIKNRLSKFLKRNHSTIIYYLDIHPWLVKTNKPYRIKYTLLSQYFDNLKNNE